MEIRACGQEQAHQVAGIGAMLGGDASTVRLHQGLVVRGIVDHSPAEKAGIRVRDEIVEVDGEKLTGIRFDDAVEKHIRGPLGSVVKVTVMRPGEAKMRTFVMVRDIVPLGMGR